MLLASPLALVALVWAIWHLAQWRHHLTSDQWMAQHMPLIRKNAQRAGLPVQLVAEVVRAESGGDERAVSHAGARGLMQLMPATERDLRQRLGISPGNAFDPEYNLALGTAYLRQLLDQFDGQVALALAAYNMGPNALQQLRAAHPHLPNDELIQQHAPAETAEYVSRIMRRYRDR